MKAAPNDVRITLKLSKREKAAFAAAAKRSRMTTEKFIEGAMSLALRRFAKMPAAERKQRARRPRPMILPTLPGIPLMHDAEERADAESPKQMVRFWHRNVTQAPWFDPGKEHIIVAILNIRFQISAYSLVSIGTVNECFTHPRDILRPVIGCSGYGFVVMHNHPSGHSDPSRQDYAATDHITKAAKIMQLRFLDHIIVGAGKDYFAFSEIKGMPLLAGPRRKRAAAAAHDVSPDKQIVIELSQTQRRKMHEELGGCDLLWFAQHASDSQLMRLANATPILLPILRPARDADRGDRRFAGRRTGLGEGNGAR
jgi:RadC-like JAB domain